MLFAWLVSASTTSQAQSPNEKSARAQDADRIAPGPAGPASAAAHSGEALFEQYCAACHFIAEVEGLLRPEGADPTSITAAMVESLREHGESSDEQDRIIVEFIRERRQR